MSDGLSVSVLKTTNDQWVVFCDDCVCVGGWFRFRDAAVRLKYKHLKEIHGQDTD